jgi:hypothetical protein
MSDMEYNVVTEHNRRAYGPSRMDFDIPPTKIRLLGVNIRTAIPGSKMKITVISLIKFLILSL